MDDGKQGPDAERPAPAPTLFDVISEFRAGGWTIYPARFCFIAFRRPMPNSEEVLTGQTLQQLADKLRAEQ
jgi:hypothetical protein